MLENLMYDDVVRFSQRKNRQLTEPGDVGDASWGYGTIWSYMVLND